MTTQTTDGLVVGDYVLYETDDGLFREAIITSVLSDEEVSIVFSHKGVPLSYTLPRVKSEWCTKHTPDF